MKSLNYRIIFCWLLSLCGNVKVFSQHCTQEVIPVLSFTSDQIDSLLTSTPPLAKILDPKQNTWVEAGFDPSDDTTIQYYFAVPGDYKHLLDKASNLEELYMWEHESGKDTARRHIIAVRETGDGKYEILNPDLANPNSKERAYFPRIRLLKCSYWTFSGLTFQRNETSRFGYKSNYNILDNCAFENTFNYRQSRLHILDSDNCTVQNCYFRNVLKGELSYDPCDIWDIDIGIILDAFHEDSTTSLIQFDEIYWLYDTSDGTSANTHIYNNYFYNLSDAVGAYYKPGYKNTGSVPGTHVCDNYFHVDEDMRLAQDYDKLENAMDFKTGSNADTTPVIVEHNTYWGYRQQIHEDQNVGCYVDGIDPGYAILFHINARNVKIRNNDFFDCTSGVFIGPGNTVGYYSDHFEIRDNRFVDIRNQEFTELNVNYAQSGAPICFNPRVEDLEIKGNKIYDTDKPIVLTNTFIPGATYNVKIDSNEIINLNYLGHPDHTYLYNFTTPGNTKDIFWLRTDNTVTDVPSGYSIGANNTYKDTTFNYCFTYEKNCWGVVVPVFHEGPSPSLHHLDYTTGIDDCVLTASTAFNNDYTNPPFVPTNITIVTDTNDVNGDDLEIEISKHFKFPGAADEQRVSTTSNASFSHLDYETTYYARIRNTTTGTCWSEDSFAFTTVQNPYEPQGIFCWDNYAPNIEVNEDGSLTKVDNGGAWDITDALKKLTGDGYIEWIIDSLNENTDHALVLSEAPDIPEDYNDGYALKLTAAGDITIFDNGTEVVLNPAVSYADGDTVRMQKDGDELSFQKNGSELHTITLSSESVEFIPGALIYTDTATFRPMMLTERGQVLTAIENCADTVSNCSALNASSVHGATSYQFRFERTSDGVVYEIVSSDRDITIAEANDSIEAAYGGYFTHLRSGEEFMVQVASIIDANTYPYSDTCTIVIENADVMTWNNLHTNLFVDTDCRLNKDDLSAGNTWDLALSDRNLNGAGYIEWEITDDNIDAGHAIVLSQSGNPVTYTSGFCFLMMQSGQIQYWEGGTNGGAGTPDYHIGDIMRIERRADDSIVCKKNDTVFHTFSQPVALSTPLIPGALIYTNETAFKPIIVESTYLTSIDSCPSGSLANCSELNATAVTGADAYIFRFSDTQNNVTYEVESDDRSISIAEANEVLYETYGGYPVHIRSGVNYDLQVAAVINGIVCPFDASCSITPSCAEAISWSTLDTELEVNSDCELEKTDNSLAWNLALTDALLTGTGYIEWEITAANDSTSHGIVLSQNSAPQNYTSGFSFLMMALGKTQAWEGTSYVSGGISSYGVGDIMRIERLPNCQIVCKQNGTIIHTFSELVPLTEPLYIGGLIYTEDAAFKPKLVETTFIGEIENCPQSDLLRCSDIIAKEMPCVSVYIFEIEESGSGTSYAVHSDDSYVNITEINQYIHDNYLSSTPEYVTSTTDYTIRTAGIINGITTPFSDTCSFTTGDMCVMTWTGLDDPIVIEDPLMVNTDCSLEKIVTSTKWDPALAEQKIEGVGYIEWIINDDVDGAHAMVLTKETSTTPPTSFTAGFTFLMMSNGYTMAWEGLHDSIGDSRLYAIDDTMRIGRLQNGVIYCLHNSDTVHKFTETVATNIDLIPGALMRSNGANIKPILKSNLPSSRVLAINTAHENKAPEISLFPNPFSHSLQAASEETVQAFVVRDLNGNVLTKCSNSSALKRASELWRPGVYTIQVQMLSKSQVFKVVKL